MSIVAFFAGDLDLDRIAKDRLRQAPDVVREGRREHQVLALRRQQGEDLLDVGQEAHVEHPVGLVEDEDLDLAEVGDPLADEVEQPARRRDEDLDPAAEGLDLGVHRDAAVDDGRAERDRPTVCPDALVDLHRQLPRRDEDQDADRVASGRERRVRVLAEPVEDRQREGRGLARAGLGGGEDVATLEDEGDGLGLDRRRGFVTLLDDGLEEVGRQAERVEGQVVSCEPDRGALGAGVGRVGCSCCPSGPPARSVVVTRTIIPDSPPATVLVADWPPGITKRRPGAPDRRGSRERRAAGEPGARGVGNGEALRGLAKRDPGGLDAVEAVVAGNDRRGVLAVAVRRGQAGDDDVVLAQPEGDGRQQRDG